MYTEKTLFYWHKKVFNRALDVIISLLAIVILSIPLFDSLKVFFVRVMKGRNPLSPGREHIHHTLLSLGFGHKKTTLILCLFAVLMIGFSYFLLDLNINISITILALISFILLYIPFYFFKGLPK